MRFLVHVVLPLITAAAATPESRSGESDLPTAVVVRAPRAASASPPKKEARIIPLDETQARTFHTIVAHPLAPAVVEFPEPFTGMPVCGDCVDGSSPPEVLANSAALFLIDLVPTEHFLTIKPIQRPRSEGGAIPDEHYLTTLTVRLRSKVTLTLRVQYGSVDAADGRVVFTLPGRAGQLQFIEEQLAKRTAELEASFAARVAASADEMVLRALLEPHSCTNVSRRERNDNLFLEVKEICRFAGRGYMRFSIENRSKTMFQLGAVEVVSGRGRDAAVLMGTRTAFSDGATDVPFQKTVDGVVSFDVVDGVSNGLQLAVTEAAGRSRRVQLADLRFH